MLTRALGLTRCEPDYQQEDQHQQADGEAIKMANAANAYLLPMLADDGSRLAMITDDTAPKFTHCLERLEGEWLTPRPTPLAP